MTSASSVRHAVALEFRRTGTDALVGVALCVPSERHVSLLFEDTGAICEPALSSDTWREVEAWDEEVTARLPFRPAPMPASTVGALLAGVDGAGVVARRFAAIPIGVESREALGPLLAKALPGLSNSRRSKS